MHSRWLRKSRFSVIGVMSGTSLDGVDLAYCDFTCRNGRWTYLLRKALTIPYSKKWHEQLSAAAGLPSEKLLQLHAAYGAYLGQVVRRFCSRFNLPSPDCVASHGHTVFHQPRKGFTFQLGDGNALHAACGFPVVCDFRSLDVALGGEGAPLVPIGDALLFGDYDVCLNLGGIANISFAEHGKRRAFDICIANMALNYLAGQCGKKYDKNGELAASGTVHPDLLGEIQHEYKSLHTRRISLGREFFEHHIRPLLDRCKITTNDKLATCVESIALEVVRALPSGKKLEVLCTGGGAFNTFLLYRLLEHGGDRVQFIVPDAEVVKFKEAIIFALLAVLRLRGEPNTLKSVTGARRDAVSGLCIGL